MKAQQIDLFGGVHPPQDMTIQDQVAYVLDQHPETRDDDMALLFWYWKEWDGLYDALCPTDEWLMRFKRFLLEDATSPETIRRRRQEVQNDRNRLRPSDAEAKYREKRSHAGPVR